MNNLERSRLAESYDEDCDCMEGQSLEDAFNYGSEAEKFKRRYQDYYSDIKIGHKEDW
ncbi:MAG: hypothetical protein HFH71_03600 [Clostridia bacterium]|nr:hypothetical protein [Clostridia bacterium]